MNDPTRSRPDPAAGATRSAPPADVEPTHAHDIHDAARPAADLADEPQLPCVPGYDLIGEIGSGGMGIVYRARDRSLNRDVAVKLLREGFTADSPAARRFLEEAQITGQLQHPGIPAVHQVGTLPGGRPFIAMKLIQGRSLADLLAGKAPINALAVFEQIAQAVGYAHAHGVIHRDLKPANVMVGAFGEVQVMDWGLAKVLGSDRAAPECEAAEPAIAVERPGGLHTRDGNAMGTAAFMPPEQALGQVAEVDRRSDVFGLGGILCMLLTGRPPYLSDDWASTLRLAAAGDLAAALDDLSRCGAEPEAIALCRQCLSPDKLSRPADGAAVAASVARLRADAEQRARQAEIDRHRAEVKAAEQHKRRRVQTILGGGVVAASLAGAIAAGWLWRRAANEEHNTFRALAHLQIEQENTAAALKQVTEEQARTAAALNELKTEQANAVEALNAMTDDVVEKLFGAQKELSANEKAFLQRVIALYEQAAAGRGDSPEARALKAQGYQRVGRLQKVLHQLADSEKNCRAACEIFDALAAEFPHEPAYRAALSASHNNLGILLHDMGRGSEAESEYRSALALLAALAAEFPGVPQYPTELASTHNNFGVLLRGMGRLSDAEAEYRAAHRLQAALVAEYPEIPKHRADLAASHNNLGVLLRGRGRMEDAEAEYRTALELRIKLAKEFPAVPEYQSELAASHNNLGLLLRATGRDAEAEKEIRNACGLKMALAAEYPAVPLYRAELAASRNSLGLLLRGLGRLAEADAEYQAAKSLLAALAAEFPDVPRYQFNLAGTLVNMANLERTREDFAAARRLLAEAEPFHKASLKAEPLNPAYRQSYYFSRSMLLLCLKSLNDHAAIPPVASELLEYSTDPRIDHYAAASFLAGALEIAGRDHTLSDARRRELAQQYADAAMQHLRQSVEAGLRDHQRIKADDTLAPLRTRDDFQQLIADLEEKSPTSQEPPPQ